MAKGYELAAVWAARHGSPALAKRSQELAFWKRRHALERGTLVHDHFEGLFTDTFALTRDFYAGKRILDVGCGPRGSLEWAETATVRIGLDPLVDAYRKLGIEDHAMQYVHATAERIPFEDRSFDVVSSFNSLDHVDDVDAAIREICRVCLGTILLITDVNHAPTPAEPQTLPWGVLDRFDGFHVVSRRRYEKSENGVYESVHAAVPYDDANPAPRYGLLVARLERSHPAQ